MIVDVVKTTCLSIRMEKKGDLNEVESHGY